MISSEIITEDELKDLEEQAAQAEKKANEDSAAQSADTAPAPVNNE